MLDPLGRCWWCRDRAERCCSDCRATGTVLSYIDGERVCRRCILRRHLDQLIAPDQPGALHGLREVILAAEPLTTRRWLDRSRDLLDGLNQGSIRLDHATLDSLPHRHSVEHLRALLITTGLLPADEIGPLRRLESGIPVLLTDLSDPHAQVVTRWIRWKVLPSLRQLHERGTELPQPVANRRREINEVATFLAGLQSRGKTLEHADQVDLDTWFRQPGAVRQQVRPFLAWAQRHKQVPAHLALPPTRARSAADPVDSEGRWKIAQRLLSDETLDPVDRVAGTLLVLYAQTLTRIVELTLGDVIHDHGAVLLRLGPDPLELPAPIAAQVLKLPHRRWDSTVEHLPTQWLFPGGHAGQHLAPTNLGARMRAIGISPRQMRRAAADQLAREVPPAMLASVLGRNIATVSTWTTQSGGQWANYAADRPPQRAFMPFE
jgi:hypothetical protein